MADAAAGLPAALATSRIKTLLAAATCGSHYNNALSLSDDWVPRRGCACFAMAQSTKRLAYSRSAFDAAPARRRPGVVDHLKPPLGCVRPDRTSSSPSTLFSASLAPCSSRPQSRGAAQTAEAHPMPDPTAGLPPRYLRTPEAARLLGLSGRTLEKHRTYGTGPLYSKIGGRVVYAVDGPAGLGRAAAQKRSTSDPAPATRCCRPSVTPRSRPPMPAGSRAERRRMSVRAALPDRARPARALSRARRAISRLAMRRT